MTLSLSPPVSLLIIWPKISFPGIFQPHVELESQWDLTGETAGGSTEYWFLFTRLRSISGVNSFWEGCTSETVNKIYSTSRRSWHGVAESDKHHGGLLEDAHSYFIHAARRPLAPLHSPVCPPCQPPSASPSSTGGLREIWHRLRKGTYGWFRQTITVQSSCRTLLWFGKNIWICLDSNQGKKREDKQIQNVIFWFLNVKQKLVKCRI